MTPPGSSYRTVAEAAWRWVLDQVREDDGPWIPMDPTATEPAYDRDGLHSGIGGLAYVLEEVRLARPWTPEEQALADAVADRLRSQIPDATDCSLFDGLAGAAGTLLALGADGADEAMVKHLERSSALYVHHGEADAVEPPPNRRRRPKTVSGGKQDGEAEVASSAPQRRTRARATA